jgi:hypothetical protein
VYIYKNEEQRREREQTLGENGATTNWKDSIKTTIPKKITKTGPKIDKNR